MVFSGLKVTCGLMTVSLFGFLLQHEIKTGIANGLFLSVAFEVDVFSGHHFMAAMGVIVVTARTAVAAVLRLV
jgi:hypothetical protein